jgi:hypothetical protein
MIAPTELAQNYDFLNTLYDHNQLIENLFQQVHGARAFVVAGGKHYGDAIIVKVSFNLVSNTVLLRYTTI